MKPEQIAPTKPARPIRGRTRQAIDLLASGEAKSIVEAAEKVGMRREAVSRALQRPDVQQALFQRLAQHRSVYGRMQAQTAILHLAQHAKSDDIRLRASVWIEQTFGMGGTREGAQGSPGHTAPIVLNIQFARIEAPNRPADAQPATLNLQATVVER